MPKLTFAGVGSAFTTDRYYQSMMVLDCDLPQGKLLIDCGTDARFALSGVGIDGAKDIDAVYISHCHSDHMGGLEWLGFVTKFGPLKRKPKLFAHESLVPQIWESLKAGMRGEESTTLETYFDVRPICHNFEWGCYKFTLFQNEHWGLVKTFGLFLEKLTNPGMTMISMDAQFNKDNPFLEVADIIFHDCETLLKPSGVHAHYDELKTLSDHIKAKMYLYHYQPAPEQSPWRDGFRAFVTKGQSYWV